MKILIIDIETTGFLANGGKIVEIGIVELNLNDGSKKIIYDKICHETGITIEECDNSWIIKNSTLTTEQIRLSNNFTKLKSEVQQIINSYPLGCTAFNNTFDFGFLEDRGIVFIKKLPCPMKLLKDICKILNKIGKYKFPTVEEAHKFFFGDVGYVESHRGADDAFHEADIVYELFKLGIFKIN